MSVQVSFHETRGSREQAALMVGLTMMAIGSLIALGWQIVSPRAFPIAGITVDRLSACLTLLVATVGAVTLRFSIRYLDGNPRQPWFLRLLAFTVVTAYVLMSATNLLLLFAAWSLTSFGLHELLTFYKDRPEANRSARKKFLISRLGDLALISAIVLIRRDWGTFDLREFLSAVALSDQTASLNTIALLIAIAALTKSAQFPFHSWLPETMETPTPVSALMHAGIINAGGALLLRFAPVMVRVPEVLLLLSVVGTITFTVGMLAMWAQVKVKRTLAWSTVSQMGFMMVQCGLGAFPAAAVHIIGHGFYKAWSFLHTGDLPKPAAPAVSIKRSLGFVLIGTGMAIPALVFASWLTGYSPQHSPGELALSAIVAISIGQLWVALLGSPSPNLSNGLKQISVATLLTFIAAVIAFSIYRGASDFLFPVLGEIKPAAGSLTEIAALLPVIAIALLSVVHPLLPVLARTSTGRALYIHSIHGFYFGAIADRVVDAIWSRRLVMKSGANHA